MHRQQLGSLVQLPRVDLFPEQGKQHSNGQLAVEVVGLSAHVHEGGICEGGCELRDKQLEDGFGVGGVGGGVFLDEGG